MIHQSRRELAAWGSGYKEGWDDGFKEGFRGGIVVGVGLLGVIWIIWCVTGVV